MSCLLRPSRLFPEGRTWHKGCISQEINYEPPTPEQLRVVAIVVTLLSVPEVVGVHLLLDLYVGSNVAWVVSGVTVLSVVWLWVDVRRRRQH